MGHPFFLNGSNYKVVRIMNVWGKMRVGGSRHSVNMEKLHVQYSLGRIVGRSGRVIETHVG